MSRENLSINPNKPSSVTDEHTAVTYAAPADLDIVKQFVEQTGVPEDLEQYTKELPKINQDNFRNHFTVFGLVLILN